MTMVWHQMARLTVVLVMLLGLTLVGPLATSAQNAGKSGATKACQQGGYAGLVGVTDGVVTVFSTTRECVTYAAQGGQLVGTVVVGPCLNGAYANLAPTEAPGTAFVSQTECVSYASQGGTLVTYVPAPTAVLSIVFQNPEYGPSATISGSGLQPGSAVTVDIIYNYGGSIRDASVGTADADGDFTNSLYFNCGTISSVTLYGTAADETPVSTSATPPC